MKILLVVRLVKLKIMLKSYFLTEVLIVYHMKNIQKYVMKS